MITRASNIVCLCGPVKEKPLFEEATKRFTLDGWIVLSPGVYDKNVTEKELELLVELHFAKIRLADIVCVIGEPGEHTPAEIAYARHLNKPVLIYVGDNDNVDSH